MTFLPRLFAGTFAALCAATSLAADTVRYATDGFGLGGLVVLANEKGYFKDEGIDAVIQTYAYGVDTVDAVLAGQADFGVIIDMPSMPRLKTGNLASVAIVGVPKPGFHKLFQRAEITTADDLKGKTVAIATGTSQEFITRTWLSNMGLDPETDVNLTGFADLFSVVGAMKAGRIDAVWLWLDGVDMMKEDDRYSLVADDSIVNQDTTTLLLTSASFNQEKPELVVATLKALHRAVGDVNSDLEGSAEMVASKLGADAGKVANAFSNNQFGLTFASGPVAAYKAKYEFLLSAGKIEPFDIFATFDSSALVQAVPEAEIDPMLAK
mgnify:CR=1 FL=1